jgi:hypothetical protein
LFLILISISSFLSFLLFLLWQTVQLGTSSTVRIGQISKLRTNGLGAGEAAESIARELEAAAMVEAVEAKMDELEAAAAENSVN